MGKITADFSGLVDFEQVAIRTINQMEDELADLRAKITPLFKNWTGEAAEAYHRAQDDWDAQAIELRDILKELHRIVQMARGNYSAALRANTAMWRRH
jgi:WXG100 family type VII secretion target